MTDTVNKGDEVLFKLVVGYLGAPPYTQIEYLQRGKVLAVADDFLMVQVSIFDPVVVRREHVVELNDPRQGELKL